MRINAETEDDSRLVSLMMFLVDDDDNVFTKGYFMDGKFSFKMYIEE